MERLRGTHQRSDIAHGADIDLAAGQERDRAAQIDRKAALDAAIDRAVHAQLRFERLFQVRPGFLATRLFARQHDGAVTIFVALDIKLDHIAGLDVRLGAGRAEFLQRDAPFGLQADIDDREFVGQANHATGDDRAVKAGVAAQGFVEERGEIFAHEMVLLGRRGPCGGGCCHVVDIFRYGGPGCAQGVPWLARFTLETRLAREVRAGWR